MSTQSATMQANAPPMNGRLTLRFLMSRMVEMARGSIRQLRRAIFLDDSELTAEEAASTLFRFFRSHHVADLRLIVTMTVIVFVFHFCLVTIFAVSQPIEHFIAVLCKSSLTDRYGGFIGTLGHGISVVTGFVIPTLGTYFATTLAVYGAVLAWAYLGASKRLGVVDLFACEIGTLCRVGTVLNIGTLYLGKYGKAVQDAQSAAERGIEHLGERDTAMTRQGSAEAFVSQEDYFPVFAGNSSDLQVLEERVVANITEFYTYMKGSRDLMRKLAETSAAERPMAYVNLIYILFLGYEAGRKSIKQLIEFEPTRAEEIVVILLTELVFYKFLHNHFASDPTDVRGRRLLLRESVYRDEVPKLCRKIGSPHGKNERDWTPAREMTDGLDTAYKAAFGETIADRIARINRAEQQQHAV